MSGRFDWAALMRVGMAELGLRPAEFWNLTPAELVFLANGGTAGGPALGRAVLQDLMNRFPDSEKGVE